MAGGQGGGTGGDTMRNYCEKKRMLVTMTVVMSSVSFAMLCAGVLTDYWLHSREQLGENTGVNGSALYRTAYSGLWRKCSTTDETGSNVVCEAIKYFGEQDDEQTDLTQQIVLSIRRATVFPLICIGLLLAGSVICFIGHCNYRHKFLTFISGVLFIFSGLFNLVGIVLYIGSVTQEVGNRKPKEMEENPRFVYNYGISFVLTVSSFVLSEFTGVICIYLYISRHKSALRKVQTRALLQRSHSEADVDAIRRRRQQQQTTAEMGMTMMSTPATPTGARSSSVRRSSMGENAAGHTTGNSSAANNANSRLHYTSTANANTSNNNNNSNLLGSRKSALSASELASGGGPTVGSHTPLMSTSAPRWCPPPPVRFVPASSSNTPQPPWRSLPRTQSQPLSNNQQAMLDRQRHHQQCVSPPAYIDLMNQPHTASSVGYTAPENNPSHLGDIIAPSAPPLPQTSRQHHHRHHHRRTANSNYRDRNRVAVDVVSEGIYRDIALSPDSGSDQQQPKPQQYHGSKKQLISVTTIPAHAQQDVLTNWNGNSSRVTTSFGGPTSNHVAGSSSNRVTADFNSLLLQPPQLPPSSQSSALPSSSIAAVRNSPPSRGSLLHSTLTNTQQYAWRVPVPPCSPPEATTTNDDMSSTSVIDSRPHGLPVSSIQMASTSAYLHTAHDRNARHSHKAKHKQGHTRSSQQIGRSSGGAADISHLSSFDLGDSSGDQATITGTSDAAMLFTSHRRNQSQLLQRQQCVEIIDQQQQQHMSVSVAGGSNARTPRLSSVGSSRQYLNSSVVADPKTSAHVSHRRTTPV